MTETTLFLQGQHFEGGACSIPSQLASYYIPPNILQLGIENFAEVQEALWEARSKWHNIGIRLKLDANELETIEVEGGMSLDKKFNLMLKTRLKKIEPCTWRNLYDALNNPTVAMSDVASKLSAKLTTGRLTTSDAQQLMIHISTAEVPDTRTGDAALSMSSTSLTNTSFDGGDTKGYTGVGSKQHIDCSRSQVFIFTKATAKPCSLSLQVHIFNAIYV